MIKYFCAIFMALIFAFPSYSSANDRNTKIELPYGILLELPNDWQSKYEKNRKLNAARPVVVLAAAKPDLSGNVLAWLKISAISDPNFFVPVDLTQLSQREKDKIISDTRTIIGQGSVPGKNDIKNISVTIENLNGSPCIKVSYSFQQQIFTVMTFNRKDIGISVETAYSDNALDKLNIELSKILSTIAVGGN